MSNELTFQQLVSSINIMINPALTKKQAYSISSESIIDYHIALEDLRSKIGNLSKKFIELIKRVIALINKGLDKAISFIDYCNRFTALSAEDIRKINLIGDAVIIPALKRDINELDDKLICNVCIKIFGKNINPELIEKRSNAARANIVKLINLFTDNNSGPYLFVSYPVEKITESIKSFAEIIKSKNNDKLEAGFKRVFPNAEWDENMGPTNSNEVLDFCNSVTKVRFDDVASDADYWKSRYEFISNHKLANIVLTSKQNVKKAGRQLKDLLRLYSSLESLEELSPKEIRSFQLVNYLLTTYVDSMNVSINICNQINKIISILNGSKNFTIK